MNNTFADAMARERENKAKLLDLYPNLHEGSGIYILTRVEYDIKYAYVGQARHILTRLAQHLVGYQHIDLSIKKHGLYDESNPTGWSIRIFDFPIEALDDKEREWIRIMANSGYQLRNHTIGGQNKGKSGMGNNRPPRGYRDGVLQGELNARRFIARVFKTSLDYSIKGKTNKNKEKALAQFIKFITIREEDD